MLSSQSNDFMTQTWSPSRPNTASAGQVHVRSQASIPVALSQTLQVGMGRPSSQSNARVQTPGFARSVSGGTLPLRQAATHSLKYAQANTKNKPTDFRKLTQGSTPRKIPAVEHRGVMIVQLRDLMDFIRGFALGPGGAISGWHDPRDGEQLYFDSINLYQVNHWVIKPLTQPTCCSYVEAVTMFPEQQRPSWFVSHWWGAPTWDFVKALEKHRDARREPHVTSTYWVCAFANNQNELGFDVTADPTQSSFFKALRICGGVLLVLEHGQQASPATALRRIWCCFEEAVVLLGHVGEKRLDIAAVKQGKAELLTDGLLEEDKRKGGLVAQTRREASFPSSVVMSGLNVHIFDAEASNPVDKNRILNSLAGRDLDKHLDPEQPIYEKVDNLLAARFGVAIMRQALQQVDRLSESDKRTYTEIMRRTLNQEAANLDFQSCERLTDSSIRMFCEMLPPTLQKLEVSFLNCPGLSKLAGLGSGLAMLENLDTVSIDFTNCTNLTSISEISQSLEGKQVKTLMLDLTGCKNLGSLSLPKDAANCREMAKFNLCCTNCTSLTSVDLQCIAKMTKLQKLRLDFSGCWSLHTDVWFSALSKYCNPNIDVAFHHADGSEVKWARITSDK